MTLWSGPLLPLAALIWPLALGLAAALPPVRARALHLLPLAPLPALVLALAGVAGQTDAPMLLLGVRLALDESARPLLGMVAALWLLAGVYAQSMAGGRYLPMFAGFWCLTLTGNLGVLLAADVVTFYVSFAAVSLAAWFLVVHDRKPEAMRAGHLYIVLAVIGEVCLLVAFLIGVQAADSFLISDIRHALADAPAGAVAVALLVAGFGIKAGMVPLHIWLPLAHPAAPVAASAVLSGAIVKAGLVGFWLFLPPGAFGTGLVVLGLAGAFAAALWGLTQGNPKAVLAYSTISQMGVMLALIGGSATAQVVAFYAVHHGLAKGALFLAVGAVMAHRGRMRVALLVAAAIAALSVAGLPLSGGGAVKAAAKVGLSGNLALAITLTGTTTALILGWFLWRLWQSPATDSRPAGHHTQRLPVFILVAAAVLCPWLIWPQGIDATPAYTLTAAAIFSALWPLAIAAVAAVCLRVLRWPGQISRPDATFPAPWRNLVRLPILAPLTFAPPARLTRLAALVTRAPGMALSVEAALSRWRYSGVAAAIALIILSMAMH